MTILALERRGGWDKKVKRDTPPSHSDHTALPNCWMRRHCWPIVQFYCLTGIVCQIFMCTHVCGMITYTLTYTYAGNRGTSSPPDELALQGGKKILFCSICWVYDINTFTLADFKLATYAPECATGNTSFPSYRVSEWPISSHFVGLQISTAGFCLKVEQEVEFWLINTSPQTVRWREGRSPFWFWKWRNQGRLQADEWVMKNRKRRPGWERKFQA